jgi:hypothetical protein
MEHVDANLSRVPPDICPICGHHFSNVVLHWRRSSSCSEPYLQPDHHEILAGLLLVGGGLASESNTHPHFQMESANRAVLEWVASQLGVFAGDVREVSRDPTHTGVAHIKETSSRDDFNQLYKLSTKKLRQLAPYTSAWYGADGGRRVPLGLQPTSTMLRTAYVVAGDIDHTGRAYIPLTRTTPSKSTVERLFQGFAPYLKSSSDYVRVTLRNTAGFLEAISPALPVAQDKWPDTVDEPDHVCPTCNGRFDRLGVHWDQNGTHGPPPVPPSLRTAIDGALLAGAYLKAGGDNSVERIHLASASRPYLKWAADHLSWLSRTVSTIQTPEEAMEGRSASTEHVSNANAVYELTTVSHPLFATLKDRLETDAESVYAEIDRTSLTVAFLVGRHGRLAEDGSELYVSTERVPAPDSVLTDLLSPWSPTLSQTGQPGRVHIPASAIDDLLDYVADDIPPFPELV